MITSAQRSVLVVEDNEDLRCLCTLFLEAEGYRVIGVGDGEEALRFLEAQPALASLIVLDLRLPRLDGLALLRLKAANPKVAHIPVIIVSATLEGTEMQAASDVKAVFSKPTSVSALLQEVDRWALQPGCMT